MLKELFKQKQTPALFTDAEVAAAVAAFQNFDSANAAKLFRDNPRKAVVIEPLIRSLTALAERVNELEARVAKLEGK